MGVMPQSSSIDGAAIRRVILVDESGVAANSGGGVYNATPPTLADGESSASQLDINGNLKITKATKDAGEDLINDVQKVENRSSYTNLTASALIKTGAGRVKGILINSHTTGTLKLWDNTSAATTVLADTMSFAAGERYIPIPDGEFATGLYATIGGTANLTIFWK